jgi:TRAP-type C4-dicarboxylate transport system permease small subunit
MKRLEHGLYVVLAAVAGLGLFLMMLLSFADVVLRKLSTMQALRSLGVEPLRGGVELTELLMVIVIFAGLPLVSMRGQHVTFELAERFIPAVWRGLALRATHAVCAVIFATLAVFMWGRAGRLIEDGLTTAQLGILVGPFAYVMAVMLAATALVHCLLVLSGEERLREGGTPLEGAR